MLQDVPDELKGKDDTKGEASLKGHLKNGEDEKSGSQAYVPPDAKKDKQLIAAVELLHGKFKPQSTAEQIEEASELDEVQGLQLIGARSWRGDGDASPSAARVRSRSAGRMIAFPSFANPAVFLRLTRRRPALARRR